MFLVSRRQQMLKDHKKGDSLQLASRAMFFAHKLRHISILLLRTLGIYGLLVYIFREQGPLQIYFVYSYLHESNHFQ